jgi:hypothetical protein
MSALRAGEGVPQTPDQIVAARLRLGQAKVMGQHLLLVLCQRSPMRATRGAEPAASGRRHPPARAPAHISGPCLRDGTAGRRRTRSRLEDVPRLVARLRLLSRPR